MPGLTVSDDVEEEGFRTGKRARDWRKGCSSPTVGGGPKKRSGNWKSQSSVQSFADNSELLLLLLLLLVVVLVVVVVLLCWH